VTAQNGATPPVPPPPAQVPVIDPGNPFALSPVLPVQWSTATVQSSAGPLTVLTLRAGGATLTVALQREHALNLARQVRQQAQQGASGLILPPSAGELS